VCYKCVNLSVRDGERALQDVTVDRWSSAISDRRAERSVKRTKVRARVRRWVGRR
jgi:hypothetical protein